MQEYSGVRFIIAVPTNLLKEEIFEKAKGQGIEVKKTPSLPNNWQIGKCSNEQYS